MALSCKRDLAGSAGSVDKYSDMGILYQKRYLIVRVDMETWADEWNEARQRILRARR